MGLTAYTRAARANEDCATVRLLEKARADAFDVAIGEPGTPEVRLRAAVPASQMGERREHRSGARVVSAFDARASLVVGRCREGRGALARESGLRERVVGRDLLIVHADEAKQQRDG